MHRPPSAPPARRLLTPLPPTLRFKYFGPEQHQQNPDLARRRYREHEAEISLAK